VEKHWNGGVHQEGCCAVGGEVLRSAIQNANHLSDERGLDVDVDNLYVKTALANEGPRMKRIRPRRWAGLPYQRRMSHIVMRWRSASAPAWWRPPSRKRSSEEARTDKRLDPERQEARSQEDRGQEERSKNWKKAAK